MTASARQLWLAPNGTGDGLTQASPAGDPRLMIESLEAGDTAWVKSGTYDNIGQMINVRHSGNRHHRICVFGYDSDPDKKPAVNPVFDFTKQPHTGDDTAKQFRGVLMNPNADYWYWRDIDITKSADSGMKLEASYCVVERCNFYHCGDTGLQLGFDKDGNGGNNRNPKYLYGRYNQIINCDSYFNYDVQDHGGNADGFANKLYPGPGNEWHGDRCWANSDDGWDLYYAVYPCLIDNCWAIYNGILRMAALAKMVMDSSRVATSRVVVRLMARVARMVPMCLPTVWLPTTSITASTRTTTMRAHGFSTVLHSIISR